MKDALPFEPQDIDVMRIRYPDAVADLLSPADHLKGEPVGNQRKHCFDFKNGIKLVISKDIVGSARMIHISGSAQSAGMASLPKTILEQEIRKAYKELVPTWNSITSGEMRTQRAYHFYILIKSSVN